jgi:cyclopropane fatty-acyl-phospholipid synthase-like methyltransferase
LASTTALADRSASYDFSGISRLTDVGGGTGELLAAVLLAYPSLRGAVFDQAACAGQAQQRFDDAGLGDRAEFIAGDFLKTIPGGADAFILKSTIHDWNDERSATILANCRKALPASGKLILVERIMPEAPADDADHRASALSDLNMLRGPGGRERTAHEYSALLSEAGFRTARIIPAGRFSLIEALAA